MTQLGLVTSRFIFSRISRSRLFFWRSYFPLLGEGVGFPRICLVAQSAGAHISSLALLQQAEREMEGGEEGVTWRALNLRTFVGISGGCEFQSLVVSSSFRFLGSGFPSHSRFCFIIFMTLFQSFIVDRSWVHQIY